MPTIEIEDVPDEVRAKYWGGWPGARVAAGRAGSLRAMLAVGAEAPHSTFTAHDGSTVRVRDLRGRWVLVWWYPKAATPG